MTNVLQGIEANPGPVRYTMVNHELRDQLITRCTALSLPCIPVLDPVIHALANYFGVEIRGTPGLQHVLDAEYFGRMDAMTFALAHDRSEEHTSELHSLLRNSYADFCLKKNMKRQNYDFQDTRFKLIQYHNYQTNANLYVQN